MKRGANSSGTAMVTASNNQNERSHRVIRRWKPPGVRQAEGTQREMQILLSALPKELSSYLEQQHGQRLMYLNEIYLQLGQIPECIFADPGTSQKLREFIGDSPCEQGHIDLFRAFFNDENNSTAAVVMKRKGITDTLHRISVITHPARNPPPVIGVAVRVGRAMEGLLETMVWETFLQDLARKRQSLLLIGRPGVGKTTVLREIARILSDDPSLNVVVVDKTCEIAGDGNSPHSAIGRARWMPVGTPNLQHVIMREAVENQSPDVIIVDEISTPQEVEAAKTIAQRGVQLIATVHGHTLPEIINCKERGTLVGGCTTVTLSGREAERRSDKCKQVQKRAREPVFNASLEFHSRSSWFFHSNIKETVDSYLEGQRSDALELQPGKAIAVAAIPGEGVFDYCRQCGLGHCNEHGAFAKAGVHQVQQMRNRIR